MIGPQVNDRRKTARSGSNASFFECFYCQLEMLGNRPKHCLIGVCEADLTQRGLPFRVIHCHFKIVKRIRSKSKIKAHSIRWLCCRAPFSGEGFADVTRSGDPIQSNPLDANGPSRARWSVFRSDHRARSHRLRAAPLIRPSRPPSSQGGEGLDRASFGGLRFVPRERERRNDLFAPGMESRAGLAAPVDPSPVGGEGGLEGRMRGQRSHADSASALHGTSHPDRAGPGLRDGRGSVRAARAPEPISVFPGERGWIGEKLVLTGLKRRL